MTKASHFRYPVNRNYLAVLTVLFAFEKLALSTFCRENSMFWQNISILRSFLPVAPRRENVVFRNALKNAHFLRGADWRLLV